MLTTMGADGGGNAGPAVVRQKEANREATDGEGSGRSGASTATSPKGVSLERPHGVLKSLESEAVQEKQGCPPRVPGPVERTSRLELPNVPGRSETMAISNDISITHDSKQRRLSDEQEPDAVLIHEGFDAVTNDSASLVDDSAVLESPASPVSKSASIASQVSISTLSSLDTTPENLTSTSGSEDCGADRCSVLEGKKVSDRASESPAHPPARQPLVPVKMFVNRIPKDMRNEELRKHFEVFGKILECNIIRDASGPKGCAFIKFSSINDAQRAIQQLHGKHVLSPAAGPVQVKYANGEIERLGLSKEVQPGGDCVKVFVGCLPRECTEEMLFDLFSQFGRVDEVYLLRDSDSKRSKCSAFITYPEKEVAQRVIASLDRAHVMEIGKRPIEVRLAESKTSMNQSRKELGVQAQELRTTAKVNRPNGAVRREAPQPEVEGKQSLLSAPRWRRGRLTRNAGHLRGGGEKGAHEGQSAAAGGWKAPRGRLVGRKGPTLEGAGGSGYQTGPKEIKNWSAAVPRGSSEFPDAYCGTSFPSTGNTSFEPLGPPFSAVCGVAYAERVPATKVFISPSWTGCAQVPALKSPESRHLSSNHAVECTGMARGQVGTEQGPSHMCASHNSVAMHNGVALPSSASSHILVRDQNWVAPHCGVPPLDVGSLDGVAEKASWSSQPSKDLETVSTLHSTRQGFSLEAGGLGSAQMMDSLGTPESSQGSGNPLVRFRESLRLVVPGGAFSSPTVEQRSALDCRTAAVDSRWPPLGTGLPPSREPGEESTACHPVAMSSAANQGRTGLASARATPSILELQRDACITPSGAASQFCLVPPLLPLSSIPVSPLALMYPSLMVSGQRLEMCEGRNGFLGNDAALEADVGLEGIGYCGFPAQADWKGEANKDQDIRAVFLSAEMEGSTSGGSFPPAGGACRTTPLRPPMKLNEFTTGHLQGGEQPLDLPLTGAVSCNCGACTEFREWQQRVTSKNAEGRLSFPWTDFPWLNGGVQCPDIRFIGGLPGYLSPYAPAHPSNGNRSTAPVVSGSLGLGNFVPPSVYSCVRPASTLVD